MGTTPNPEAKEFYTYRYFANNRTFYIGKGHWVEGQKIQRVNDRLKDAYREEKRGAKHTGLTKILVRLHRDHKLEIRWEILGNGKRDLTEDEADAQEQEYILKYLKGRCRLANRQKNPRPRTDDDVIAWVLSGDGTTRGGEVLEWVR